MRTYDLYGFEADDIEVARHIVEIALDIKMVAHRSSYIGDYYKVGAPGQQDFMLRHNVDPLDTEPAEQDFPDVRVLLYVNEPERPEEIQRRLTASTLGIRLLRRRTI